jgi:hypothetical protein
MASSKKFDKEKRIAIPIPQDGRIIVIYRANYLNKNRKSKLIVKEFSVNFELLIEDKWRWIRRHCWMEHSKTFHTHIRLGKSRRNTKRIDYFSWKKGIVSTLNWSKKDMLANWFNYRIKYLKKLRFYDKI